jgi:pseudaminic acid cytidylyltransferase
MAGGAIAIIPARGGSKRLPRKNIADFHGKPVIAYTIEAARDCGCFDRVVVSTEDAEIAAVASSFGAEIVRRSERLATDEARVTDVCLDLLATEEEQGRAWSLMSCLYATAPMRDASDIRQTVALLEPGRHAFAMAVVRFSLPPHQALKLAKNGDLAPMWPDLIEKRSSDLPALVVDNGSTYAVEAQSFRQHRTFYGPGLRGYEMPPQRSIDIDTGDDLAFALWSAQRIGMARPAGATV